MPTQEEKTQGMLVWLLSIFIGIFSPIIFMLISKEKPFVYANAMQCLTLQIFVTVAAILLWMVCLGWIASIIGLIFAIMGTIAANNGTVYEPPMTGPLAKKWFNV